MKNDGPTAHSSPDAPPTHVTQKTDRTMANLESQSPIRSGGADSALDMSNERDRGLVRRALRDWPGCWRRVDDTLKDEFVEGLTDAQRAGRTLLGDAKTLAKGAEIIASCTRTLVMIVGQDQVERLAQHKDARMDNGDPTEVHRVMVGGGVTEEDV